MVASLANAHVVLFEVIEFVVGVFPLNLQKSKTIDRLTVFVTLLILFFYLY